jgi:hypothetical protein
METIKTIRIIIAAPIKAAINGHFDFFILWPQYSQ